MKKSDIKQLPEYFDYYIHLNEDIELEAAFDKSLSQIDEIDMKKMKSIGLKVYAEEKWTIHKIIQRVTDWERIWCYRTLLYARGEGTIPPGHDHELMATHSNANELPLELLLAELRAARLSTKAMFGTYNHEIFEKNCSFYKYQMFILAMGFNIIGHQLHHFNIIKERYFPLDKND